MDNNTTVPCFYAFIRHGERADQTSNDDSKNFVVQSEQTNPIDPPLTITGIKQAQATGHFLGKYFTDYAMKFDTLVIQTSPFLRCIMTAAEIA